MVRQKDLFPTYMRGTAKRLCDMKTKIAKRILVVLGVILYAAFTISGVTHTYYPLAATVCDVDYRHDVVTMIDGAGNSWSFNGCEDWMRGDIVAMIMDGCGTQEIYDDEIVMLRYAGNAT